MPIGARLKQLRIAKGQSLQQVAEAVGSSKPHIWELETERSKNPSLELLTRLAGHFGVSVSYLVGETAATEALVFGREFKGITEEDKALILRMAERMTGKKSDG